MSRSRWPTRAARVAAGYFGAEQTASVSDGVSDDDRVIGGVVLLAMLVVPALRGDARLDVQSATSAAKN